METHLPGTPSPSLQISEKHNGVIYKAIADISSEDLEILLVENKSMSESDLIEAIKGFLSPKKKLPKKIAARILFRRTIQFISSVLKTLAKFQLDWETYIWPTLYQGIIHPIRRGKAKKSNKKKHVFSNHSKISDRPAHKYGRKVQLQTGNCSN